MRCLVVPLFAVLSLAVSTQQASASQRRFAYTYSTLTAPVGEVELENWVTWKNRPNKVNKFEFRHELEIGLTDKTQLGLYFANWDHDARSGKNAFSKSAVEIIHNLSNPVSDTIGSAIYGEVWMGERSFGIESKLLLEKRIGRWTVAWNGKIEAEWEGDRFADLQEASGELGQTFGIAYDITKSLSLGAELTHKLPMNKWHAPADAQVYVGPNVTYRKGRFFATVTTLFQTTNKQSAGSIESRAIVGVSF